MFDRFTDRARRAMAIARKEAQRFNHDFIGTEHILLGIWNNKNSNGHAILVQLGFDDSLVTKVSSLVEAGPTMVTMGQLPFTPRVKEVLGLAGEYADNRKEKFIGTEHLLMGLVRQKESVAYDVLNERGVTTQLIDQEVNKLRKQEGETVETKAEGKKEVVDDVEEYGGIEQAGELGEEEYEVTRGVDFIDDVERLDRLKCPLIHARQLNVNFKDLRIGDNFISPDPELNEKGKYFLFVKSEDVSVRGTSSSWNAFRPATGQHYGFKPEHEVIWIE